MLSRLGRAHRSPRDRGESGASAVELAFIAPAFILLIFFTIQGSLYFYGRSVAIQSAREGVSQLRLAQSKVEYAQTSAATTAATERFADQVGRAALLDPKAVPTYDNDAARVSMTVSGRAISLIPFLPLPTITENASGSVERFQNLDSN